VIGDDGIYMRYLGVCCTTTIHIFYLRSSLVLLINTKSIDWIEVVFYIISILCSNKT
jgi:hypothetical protein